MSQPGRIYRMSAAGRRAWQSQDASVPADYQRILGMLDTDTHVDVVRGCLRRYPDRLIRDWLGELEELGLVEWRPEEESHDLDFTGDLSARALIPKDRERLEREAASAGSELSRKGVYLAMDRLKQRVPSGKAPADTTVLIVEDDPDQLALAEMRVQMAGFAARSATSAAALREALAEGPPDLLLLDVMLPDGDGFDILAHLRSHPPHALLPIVMLTVKDDPNDIRRGLALGADGYITKPYSKQVLEEVFAKVLGTAPRAG